MKLTLEDTAVQQSLVLRLKNLNPESEALWGSMSVEEMLPHMNDSFRIALGMKDVVVKSSFFWSVIAKKAVLYILPSMPRNAATAPELHPRKKGSPARDFHTEQAYLEQMISVFRERESEKLKPHPLFGRMSKKEWSGLLAMHLDHHFRQFGV